MYRQFLQSRKLMNFFLNESSSCININFDNYITKRWAGHSKWSNIKHTKALNDANRSSAFQKLCYRINVAVREGGEDPKVNSKLRSLIEMAHKISMPKTTIEKAIKGAKNNKLEKPYWLLFSRPDNLLIAFEVVSKNPLHAQGKIYSVFKRLNVKVEKCPDYFVEKGVIISEPLKDVESSIEKATDDAIEIGIEEVQEDDDKSLIFECLPAKLDIAQKKLEDKGYKIQSATTEIEFYTYIDIKESEVNNIKELTEKLNRVFDDVLRVSFNQSLVNSNK